MGVILSRLRAKPSTKEQLEDIGKEIEIHEEYKRSTEAQRKKVVGSWIFYFMIFFIIGAGLFILYYLPKLETTKDKVLYSLPILAAPLVFIVIKKFLHWYFTQDLLKHEEKLIELKRRRRSLLEHAMETETYRAVKELLEKYDPEYQRKLLETPAIEAPKPTPTPMKGSYGEYELRKRTVVKTPVPTISPGQTVTLHTPGPLFSPLLEKPITNTQFPPPYLQRAEQHFVRAPMQPMPRPVLPRERTLIDRLVDYLVGDGPSNRYALICRQCQSHNGMALREEFEFIAFRCCYCFHWNPPHSQQQPSPRLPLPAPTPSPTVIEPVSEMSNSSADDMEGDDESSALEGKTQVVSGSPKSPRRKLNLSSDSEIHATLEEDVRTHT